MAATWTHLCMYVHINMYIQTHTPKHIKEGKVNYDDTRHLTGITMTAVRMPAKWGDSCHTVIGEATLRHCGPREVTFGH